MFRKSVIASVLGALLLVGGTVPALASDRDQRCEQRIRKAELNLDKAVRRHGRHSRQAENRRRELERVRHQCRVEHRYR